MPATSPPLVLIEDQSGLEDLVRRLADCPVAGVDTESNSLYAYRERVCLLQFSISDGDFIVDPLRVADVAPLASFFNSRSTEKVFHAAEYDILCLARDYQFEFNSIFDTMIAARTLGWPQVGLAAVVESRFHVTLNKKHQRADWGRRPLTQEQLEYARVDTRYLPALRDIQEQELSRMERRAEAFEEFDRLTRLRAPASAGPDPMAFWRIDGALRLTPRQASMLKELVSAREDEARRADQPPFKIMNDAVLLEVARRAPADMDALRGVPGLSSGQLRRYADVLLAAVRRGFAGPDQRPPRRPVEDEAVVRRYERLHDWRKRKARSRGVESDVIVPRSALWELARRPPRTVADLESVSELGPWRRETYGAEIIRALNAPPNLALQQPSPSSSTAGTVDADRDRGTNEWKDRANSC
jgi:ribonuclease D